MLRPATELKAIADALDLTPLLDQIGDQLTVAAQAGEYEANVIIKDSVYAGRLAAIGAALQARGYAIGFIDDFTIQVNWKNAV